MVQTFICILYGLRLIVHLLSFLYLSVCRVLSFIGGGDIIGRISILRSQDILFHQYCISTAVVAAC